MKKFAKITAVVLLAVLALTALVACGYPSDPEKAKEQLEKKGYTAVLTKDPTGLSSLTANILATKIDDDGKGEMITIAYYKDADAAKKAYEDAKKNMDEAKKEAKEQEMDVKMSVSRYGTQVVAKMSGDLSKMF